MGKRLGKELSRRRYSEGEGPLGGNEARTGQSVR